MPRQKAFTLIELLVVISIIAVLIAILLPSLSAARERNRTTVCLTHLRSLSHGWHMYADDNGDITLPGRYFKASGGTSNPENWYDVGNGLKYRPRWVATLGKYVGIFAFDKPQTNFDRQDYDSKIYQCPTAPNWIDERNYAYGYNHQFLGNARKTADQFHNFPVNRSRISSFAGTVLGADCLGTAGGVPTSDRKPYNNGGTDFAELGNHGWTLDPPRLTATSDRGTGDAGSPRAAVDPRHLQKTNVIYCDGHGETQSPVSLGYRVMDDGSFQDGGPAGPGQPSNFFFSGTARDDDPPDRPM
ncbi:MAG: prepilin-type N-terminal cleavage/methylation domain-containing protein [Phycisphaerales bacterium]|nr:prepilin-type N-terminal cleavage/methylation domain-containing protein [Phycisphaerales bacterium]